MIKIYVDMSEATEAEKNGLRPSDISTSCKAALEARSVTPDISISFTNERVIEQGRILATTIGTGVTPGSVQRTKILADEAIKNAKR